MSMELLRETFSLLAIRELASLNREEVQGVL